MARKALITGGAGLIGSHLAEFLLEQGWEVYALDDLSTSPDANVFHPEENSHLHLTVESALEMFQRIPSIEKIRAAIGWAPTTDLDGILAEVIEHSRLQPARAG